MIPKGTLMVCWDKHQNLFAAKHVENPREPLHIYAALLVPKEPWVKGNKEGEQGNKGTGALFPVRTMSREMLLLSPHFCVVELELGVKGLG